MKPEESYEVKTPWVMAILRAAFGGTSKRKPVVVRRRETVHVADYWDGGSRTEVKFIDLRTMTDAKVEYVQQSVNNPYNQRMGTAR